jgi:Glycosyl transferases group 1
MVAACIINGDHQRGLLFLLPKLISAALAAAFVLFATLKNRNLPEKLALQESHRQSCSTACGQKNSLSQLFSRVPQTFCLLAKSAISKVLIPEASLTIVGDGNDQSTYVALAQSLGLSYRVTFAGRLPVAEAMKRGRVMVLPSRNESFPYVVIEAAAARVPTIASAVGGIPEIMPAALLCQDRSPQTLAGKMRQALIRDKAFETASEQMFADVKQRCSARGMVQSVTDFYATLKSSTAR